MSKKSRNPELTTKEAAVPAVEPVAGITIVGCLKPSDQTATGPAGTADTKYMLTDAKTGTSNSATGTSGSTAASTYRLDDSTNAMLTPEVGHQVEIVAVAPQPDPKAKAREAEGGNDQDDRGAVPVG